MGMEDMLKGVGSGAATGTSFGPWGTAIGAGVGALGSLFGGGLSRRKTQPTETPMQAKQRELVDQLLSSLSGEGPYADLFKADDATFQRSYVDPAKARFRTQTAPMIQQAAIAGGQQRGSGLEDTLTRAGVDMDMLLNQQYGQMQEAAQQRQQSMIGNILGMGPGAPVRQPSQSFGSAAGEGLSTYLASPAFGGAMSQFGSSWADRQKQKRAGFENAFNEVDRGGIA